MRLSLRQLEIFNNLQIISVPECLQIVPYKTLPSSCRILIKLNEILLTQMAILIRVILLVDLIHLVLATVGRVSHALLVEFLALLFGH